MQLRAAHVIVTRCAAFVTIPALTVIDHGSDDGVTVHAPSGPEQPLNVIPVICCVVPVTVLPVQLAHEPQLTLPVFVSVNEPHDPLNVPGDGHRNPPAALVKDPLSTSGGP